MTDHELEAFLQTLQPRRLPARVLAGVATGRRSEDGAGGRVAAFLAQLAGLVVRGVVCRRIGGEPAHGAAGRGAAAPMGAPVASIVVQGGEQDFITLPDGSPARRYRIHSLETVSWTDPKTRASLRWTLPREDIEVVPVRAY